MLEKKDLIKFIEQLSDAQYEKFYCVISDFVNKVQGTHRMEFDEAMEYIFKNYDETFKRLSDR